MRSEVEKNDLSWSLKAKKVVRMPPKAKLRLKTFEKRQTVKNSAATDEVSNEAEAMNEI